MKVPKNNWFLLKNIYYNINTPDGVEEEILPTEVTSFETSVSMFESYEIGRIEFQRKPNKSELMTEKLMSLNGSRLFVSFETAIEKEGFMNFNYYILKVHKTVEDDFVKYRVYFTDFTGYLLNFMKSNKKYKNMDLKQILDKEIADNDLNGTVIPANTPKTDKYFLDKTFRSKEIQKVGELEKVDFNFYPSKPLGKEIKRFFNKTGEILMSGLHRTLIGKPSELFKMFKEVGPIITFKRDAYADIQNPYKYYGIRMLPPNSSNSMANTPMVSQFKIDFRNKKVKSERYNMGDALEDDGNGIELPATSKHTNVSKRQVLFPSGHNKVKNEYMKNILNKNLIEIITYGRVGMDIGAMVNVEYINDINVRVADPHPRVYETIVVGINNKITDRYFIQTLRLSVLKEK